MSGSATSRDKLDERRKRLIYRCWHRGTREMDLILGRFADAHMSNLDTAELDDLEQLITLPDPDLYAAFSGATPPAGGEYATAIFARIRAFARSDRHE